MKTPTISSLFTDAAKRLRTDFETVRSSIPHPSEKGEEVEKILRTFLNNHLPQRFRAGSGFILDIDNQISKQTDVIVYDVLSSAVYRPSEKTQILPSDNVATVIEVKTNLNKSTIEDAYKKIASCKELKKRPHSQLDQKSTGSELVTTGTQGIIFGFDSDTSLETLASNMKEFNEKYDSNLWPNMLVLLDKGIINYGGQYPGENYIIGDMAPETGDEFIIPPLYINMIIHNDDEFSLNRFFMNLLAHLTFYPYRTGSPPFDVMLEGASKEIMTITGYQYGLDRQLKPVPKDQYIESNSKPPLTMRLYDENKKPIGSMQYIPWQDGCIVRWLGPIPLKGLIVLFLPNSDLMIMPQSSNNAELTTVFQLSEEDFKKWPKILEQNSNMTGVIIEIGIN